jgi:hypothetical protein
MRSVKLLFSSAIFGGSMNKIDLIIEFCENMANMRIKGSDEALAAARELRELKPVAWMLPEYGDVLSASEADGTCIYNVPLYAFDEVTK